MKQFVPDDSALVPAADTVGARFMAEVAAKAKAIYPDHGESRTKYIEEKAAERITQLWVELQQLKGGQALGDA